MECAKEGILFATSKVQGISKTLDIVAGDSDEYARRASGLLALLQQLGTFLAFN